jgi:dephospho-CoA kinase
MRIVIGIVGPIASGKGFIADYLGQMGFTKYSLSERVREEAVRRGVTASRENLQDIGDDLRKKYGNAILVEKTLNLISDSDSQLVVIDGIRNAGELTILRDKMDAKIIGVNADPQVRFKRSKARGRSSDFNTWEDFDRAEKRDRGVGQKGFGQGVDRCLKIADYIIENNGTYKEFKKRSDEVFQKLGIE